MPREPRDLSTAPVVVMGATGVLGRKVVERLQALGADVIAVARDRDRLDSVPDVAARVVADLTDPGATKAVLDAVDGDIGGVVNAAGVVAFGPLQGLPPDILETLFAINATGPLRLTQGLLPRIVDGGFVAHIPGVIAEQPMAGLAAYSASKAALSAALTALRREVRGRGIDVVDLRPPHTETGLATRPVAGTAPRLPEGADPDHVADVIIDSLRTTGTRDVGPDAFAA